MKKVITTFLAILLILCSLCTLTACKDLYYSFFPEETYERYEEGNWKFAYSERFNDAVVGNFNWDGDWNNTEIIIPDTFKGAPVTAWGGAVINSKGWQGNIYWGNLDPKWNSYYLRKVNTKEEVAESITSYLKSTKDVEIKDLTFNLYLGPNLKEFEYDQEYEPMKRFMFYSDDNGKVVVYVQCFNVTVHIANPTYYADELGRLYYKDTNKLVPHIIYHNRDTFPEGSLPTE